MLLHCSFGVRKSTLPIKLSDEVFAWVGISVMEPGTDFLHVVQLMSLPSHNPIISCLGKVQNGFTCLVPVYLRCPGIRGRYKQVFISMSPPPMSWAAGGIMFLGCASVSVCWRGYLSGARCRLAYGPAQLMPLPLTVSCFSKIQIGFTFLVLAHPGSPGKRAVKRVRVCVSVRACVAGRRHCPTGLPSTPSL